MRMGLRALLFSSDGTSTSTLCQVLTELGIEAEICPEVLVAVQRISQETYDAILVDWDQEAEAIRLLKAVREQKNTSQALNLALVQNEKDLPRALQHGANSAIRKPVDPRQAKDTLSTARDLVLSRRAEQKTKAERVAAEQAAIAAASAEVPVEEEPPAPKTGFLAQTAARSAFEAAESSGSSDSPVDPLPALTVGSQANGLQAEPQAPEIPTINKKRWDEKPQPQETISAEVATRELPPWQDSTGVFSSLPEQGPQPEPENKTRRRYWVFALAACLVVAAVLWVWAPGDSYQRVLSSLVHSISRVPRPNSPQPAVSAAAQSVGLEQPVPPSPPAPIPPSEQLTPMPTDPGPFDSSEVDPDGLQVIETKAIPKPGAQLPVSTDTPADQGQFQPVASQPEPPSSAPARATTAEASAPAMQPAPHVQPAVAPAPRQQVQVVMPVHQNAVPPSAGRTGVIIPDSLRTAPSQAPVVSVDSGVVSEEVSRNLVEHRVEPGYPAQALSQRLEGAVILQISVAKDGTVQDVKLLRGNFALARAAFDAVRQWRFKAYTPNGKPVDFQTVVTVNFKYPG
jgi:TonB family protein